MVPRKLRLNDTEDMTNIFPESRITYREESICNIDTYQKPICRICLDDCDNILFCLCKGSSMVH